MIAVAYAFVVVMDVAVSLLVVLAVVGAFAMGRRNRKLREKGEIREHLYHRVAREALKELTKVSWDDLPEPMRIQVLVAICDAERGGHEAMLKAAGDEFSYLAERERMGTLSEE